MCFMLGVVSVNALGILLIDQTGGIRFTKPTVARLLFTKQDLLKLRRYTWKVILSNYIADQEYWLIKVLVEMLVRFQIESTLMKQRQRLRKMHQSFGQVRS